MYVNRYDAELNDWCDCRETSIEIGMAIASLAKTERGMQRIWESPKPREEKKVIKLAWKFWDADKDEYSNPWLYWGITKLFTCPIPRK